MSSLMLDVKEVLKEVIYCPFGFVLMGPQNIPMNLTCIFTCRLHSETEIHIYFYAEISDQNA